MINESRYIFLKQNDIFTKYLLSYNVKREDNKKINTMYAEKWNKTKKCSTKTSKVSVLNTVF